MRLRDKISLLLEDKHMRIFRITPEEFRTREDYNHYRENMKCAACKEKIQIGEKYTLISVKEGKVGNWTVETRIIHKKCLKKIIFGD